MARDDRMARLVRLHALLSAAPLGLHVNEIARHLEVSRRTAYRDLLALTEQRFPLRSDNGRWLLDPSYRLRPVNLTLDEAMALFIASRLAHHHADERNRALEQALEKLAQVLPAALSSHVLATVRTLRERPANADFTRALEVLTRAWAEGRTVRLWYSRPGEAARERCFDPYFIEPSAAGHATYAIGHDHASGEVRTFKIERIRAIELTNTTFAIPASFQADRYLRGRWGIGFGDETEVRLRFSPAAAPRVRESVWHPSQSLAEEPGGTLLMTLRVAGTLEITPWILSWGDEVEVLGPAELRRTIAGTARALVRRYAGDDEPAPPAERTGGSAS
jgi:predicted DNA-binding transcriptional regulator YafY